MEIKTVTLGYFVDAPKGKSDPEKDVIKLIPEMEFCSGNALDYINCRDMSILGSIPVDSEVAFLALDGDGKVVGYVGHYFDPEQIETDPNVDDIRRQFDSVENCIQDVRDVGYCEPIERYLEEMDQALIGAREALDDEEEAMKDEALVRAFGNFLMECLHGGAYYKPENAEIVI